MVKEFHKRFLAPYEDSPKALSPDRANKRAAWMREEIDEFLEARDISDQADAMIDLIYFALGTMVEMGAEPQELFDIVHAANMAKLFPDGKPHFNSMTKTIKPPGWEDPKPRLIAAIERMAQRARADEAGRTAGA